jgi:hypothetical protein
MNDIIIANLSVIHRMENKILAIQERCGKLKQEQEDFLCPEVKMIRL